MMQKQLRFIKISLQSLRSRSVRSWITIFGIVVSIAVILILLTLSAGLQRAVVNLFEDLGSDRMFILGPDGDPRSLTQVTLTDDTVKTIRSISSFDLVIPRLILPAQRVEWRSKERFITVGGFESDQFQDILSEYNLQKEIATGRFLRNGEKSSVVIGGGVAEVDVNLNSDDDTWPKPIAIKNTIRISGEEFKVVGTFKKGIDFDNIILMSLEDARRISNKTNEISAIDAVVKPGIELPAARYRLEQRLNQTLGEDNYIVITPEGILRQFTQIITVIQAVLLAIASVSLIVGAVGIMNTMFTSVLEREREIGIMKSVGSRNSDIMTLFLMESGFIGVIGGFAGVIIGIGVSFAIGAIAAAAGFPLLTISISYIHVIGCLLFSFVIGMVSGLVPSYRASRKKIVDTLREA